MLGSCTVRVALPTLDDGRQAYVDACASCHGLDAKGHGPVAAELKTTPPDLTQLAARYGGNFPREIVIQTITGARAIPAHGPREMPVWSQRFGHAHAATAAAEVYARRRVEVMTDYLESIQRRTSN